MRPPRTIILVAFSLSALLTICLSMRSSRVSRTVTTASTEPQSSRLQAFFSLRAPFSLFPPNAIITLTHDNTTAFLARPAAFGPLLPTAGLRGQVWIGSGFGDDSLRQGGVASTSEGELGCSDVPGYISSTRSVRTTTESSKLDSEAGSKGGKSGDWTPTDNDPLSFPQMLAEDKISNGQTKLPSVDDGTDDYLHHPLPHSTVTKATDKLRANPKTNHADIQSLQEGAEIAGKVVLLSRGGCGFLEKVKWAQRRGAIALIVADDQKGGPLIQMYARGDITNVTIPAIFTSHTTAHLLSSLMGSETFVEDVKDENGKPTSKVQSKDATKKTPSRGATTPQDEAIQHPPRASKKIESTIAEQEAAPLNTQKPGWFGSWFSGASDSKSGSSRPPSSGQHDWVLVEDWEAEDEAMKKALKSSDKFRTMGNKAKIGSTDEYTDGDDFVIGVQDWRDPDLVGTSSSKEKGNKKDSKVSGKKTETYPEASNAESTTKQPPAGKKTTSGSQQEHSQRGSELKGGSIVPSSGEYDVRSSDMQKTSFREKQKEKKPVESHSTGLLSRIFGTKHKDDDKSSSRGSTFVTEEEACNKNCKDQKNEFEGLWVTLTPTSGASPFLDTLLVLVVSPLVTLTAVYALLLNRSRMRRRRWRAPKSVVERLPVRTYQTIRTSGNSSPRTPSPTGPSPSTPLLQRGSIARPRSRTTTSVPEASDITQSVSSPLQVPSILIQTKDHEKPFSASGEWRKFMGRQVECVVCLEEYVDGVSRVMSLPCGHEFHVDCITPWLTTRRRTCPICKGDVVRSLACGSHSSPHYETYYSDSEDGEDTHHSTHDDEDHDADIERQHNASSPVPDRNAGDAGVLRLQLGERSNWEFEFSFSISSVFRDSRAGSKSLIRWRRVVIKLT